MNNRQLQLVGGPLDGRCHELLGEFMPAKIALDDGAVRHWYEVREDGKAYFEMSEPVPEIE